MGLHICEVEMLFGESLSASEQQTHLLNISENSFKNFFFFVNISYTLLYCLSVQTLMDSDFPKQLL
jgi:hypothetical protein